MRSSIKTKIRLYSNCDVSLSQERTHIQIFISLYSVGSFYSLLYKMTTIEEFGPRFVQEVIDAFLFKSFDHFGISPYSHPQ